MHKCIIDKYLFIISCIFIILFQSTCFADTYTSYFNSLTNSGGTNKQQNEYFKHNKKLINKNLSGIYKITFFGSQVVNIRNASFTTVADLYYISNDCKKAEELYPNIVNNGIKNKCNFLSQSKLLDGMVAIVYNDNYFHIKSRIQMENGVVEMSESDKYQYTIYSPVIDDVVLQGKGMTNWNYNTKKNTPAHHSTVFLDSPFVITKLNNGVIRLDATLVGKKIKVLGKDMVIDAVNTLLLEKIDSQHTTLDNIIQKKFSK